jgi:hypothetical protein
VRLYPAAGFITTSKHSDWLSDTVVFRGVRLQIADKYVKRVKCIRSRSLFLARSCSFVCFYAKTIKVCGEFIVNHRYINSGNVL